MLATLKTRPLRGGAMLRMVIEGIADEHDHVVREWADAFARDISNEVSLPYGVQVDMKVELVENEPRVTALDIDVGDCLYLNSCGWRGRGESPDGVMRIFRELVRDALYVEDGDECES